MYLDLAYISGARNSYVSLKCCSSSFFPSSKVYAYIPLKHLFVVFMMAFMLSFNPCFSFSPSDRESIASLRDVKYFRVNMSSNVTSESTMDENIKNNLANSLISAMTLFRVSSDLLSSALLYSLVYSLPVVLLNYSYTNYLPHFPKNLPKMSKKSFYHIYFLHGILFCFNVTRVVWIALKFMLVVASVANKLSTPITHAQIV